VSHKVNNLGLKEFSALGSDRDRGSYSWSFSVSGAESCLRKLEQL